jgi:hypothetical protein
MPTSEKEDEKRVCAVRNLPKNASPADIDDMLVFMDELKQLAKKLTDSKLNVFIIAEAKKIKITYQGREVRDLKDLRNAWQDELDRMNCRKIFAVLFGTFETSPIFPKIHFELMQECGLYPSTSRDVQNVTKTGRVKVGVFYNLIRNKLRDTFRSKIFSKKKKGHGVKLIVSGTNGQPRKRGKFIWETCVQDWGEAAHRDWLAARGETVSSFNENDEVKPKQNSKHREETSPPRAVKAKAPSLSYIDDTDSSDDDNGFPVVVPKRVLGSISNQRLEEEARQKRLAQKIEEQKKNNKIHGSNSKQNRFVKEVPPRAGKARAFSLSDSSDDDDDFSVDVPKRVLGSNSNQRLEEEARLKRLAKKIEEQNKKIEVWEQDRLVKKIEEQKAIIESMEKERKALKKNAAFQKAQAAKERQQADVDDATAAAKVAKRAANKKVTLCYSSSFPATKRFSVSVISLYAS